LQTYYTTFLKIQWGGGLNPPKLPHPLGTPVPLMSVNSTGYKIFRDRIVVWSTHISQVRWSCCYVRFIPVISTCMDL